MIIFGSTAGEGTETDIGVYKAGDWYTIGKLKSQRHSYGAVVQAGIVMIVGGEGEDGIDTQ